MSQHERSPLTRHEETELARIGQRLWRDGVRLDRSVVRPEWPYQLAGVLMAALGGMMCVGAVLAGARALAVMEGIGGGLVIVAAAVVAVTPVRRGLVRGATALHWRLTGPAAGPASRRRRLMSHLRRRIRRRDPG